MRSWPVQAVILLLSASVPRCSDIYIIHAFTAWPPSFQSRIHFVPGYGLVALQGQPRVPPRSPVQQHHDCYTISLTFTANFPYPASFIRDQWYLSLLLSALFRILVYRYILVLSRGHTCLSDYKYGKTAKVPPPTEMAWVDAAGAIRWRLQFLGLQPPPFSPFSPRPLYLAHSPLLLTPVYLACHTRFTRSHWAWPGFLVLN